MKNNKYYLITGLIGLIITTLAVSSLTQAQETTTPETPPDPSSWPEKRQTMIKVFEDNDYDVWQAQMNEKISLMRQRADELASQTTPENFAKLVEAHRLMTEGKIEEAKTIMAELELRGPPMGFGHGEMGFGHGFKAGCLEDDQ